MNVLLDTPNPGLVGRRTIEAVGRGTGGALEADHDRDDGGLGLEDRYQVTARPARRRHLAVDVVGSTCRYEHRGAADSRRTSFWPPGLRGSKATPSTK